MGKERTVHQELNSTILRYAHHGQYRVALQLYELMQEEDYIPTKLTSTAALKACIRLTEEEAPRLVHGKHVKLQCLQSGTAIHAHILKSGFENGTLLENSLIEMYSKCGSLIDACRVFERIQKPNLTAWNRLLLGCSQNGEPQLTLQLYARMQDEGIIPGVLTFVAVGKACADLAELEGSPGSLVGFCLERAISIHHQAVSTGEAGHMFVGSTFVDMYAKSGSLEDAREVFERMQQRDSVSWSSMINAYVQSGQAVAALELLSRMQLEGDVLPNASIFVVALKACAFLADKEREDLAAGKFVRKPVTKCCLQKGRFLHSQAVTCGHKLNRFMANTLIDMYAKCQSMVEASNVFKEMPEPDVVSWTAMILGSIRCGDEKRALELYSSMLSARPKIKPDAVVVAAALKACANLAEQEQGKLVEGRILKLESLRTGKSIHVEAARQRNDKDMYVATKLVDMYSKCGSMMDAREVFDKMPKRDDVSWASIILGYAQNGHSDMALELYQRMQEDSSISQKNAVAYVAVLKACSDMGALETGMKIHESICRFGLETDMKIANSLMDFYSKCKNMVETERLFAGMISRDAVTWNTLIAGYTREGEVAKAFDIFDNMLKEKELRPDRVTFLSLLSGCSHAGMVDKGKQCFQAMKAKYGISPQVEHYACMIDLLGRANLLEEAVLTIESMPMKPCESLWLALLSACRTWKNAALGRRAFEALVELGSKSPAAYMLMTSITKQ